MAALLLINSKWKLKQSCLVAFLTHFSHTHAHCCPTSHCGHVATVFHVMPCYQLLLLTWLKLVLLIAGIGLPTCTGLQSTQLWRHSHLHLPREMEQERLRLRLHTLCLCYQPLPNLCIVWFWHTRYSGSPGCPVSPVSLCLCCTLTAWLLPVFWYWFCLMIWIWSLALEINTFFYLHFLLFLRPDSQRSSRRSVVCFILAQK